MPEITATIKYEDPKTGEIITITGELVEVYHDDDPITFDIVIDRVPNYDEILVDNACNALKTEIAKKAEEYNVPLPIGLSEGYDLKDFEDSIGKKNVTLMWDESDFT